MNKKLLNYMFRLRQCKVTRCLEPRMECDATAIKSHSVQNASILDVLQEDGHVVSPQMKTEPSKGNSLVFERVGRNIATTFTGLCAKHDCTIFLPIEKNEVDIGNPLHLFLLAYRAVLRELHATMEAATRIQFMYQKIGDLGIIPLDVPTPEGMEAVSAMNRSYETYKYKLLFDRALLTDDLSEFNHRVLTLKGLSPTTAVNSLFQRSGEGRIALNVFPVKDGVAAIFSYHKSDSHDVGSFLSELPMGCDDSDLERLSLLIIENCENFVLAPAFVRRLTGEQKQQILDLLLATLYTRKAPPNAHAINLFQSQSA